MYSAPSGTKVLDIRLLAESNKNGYIDFNADIAAFKAFVTTASYVNKSSIDY